MQPVHDKAPRPSDRAGSAGRPASVSDVLAEVERSGPGDDPMILAPSSLTFGDDGSIRRVGVFAERGDTLELLADARVDDGCGPDLLEGLQALGVVRVGTWDAMYADAWHHVWRVHDEALVLWGRDGVLARADRQGLDLAGQRVAWADLDHVEVHVDDVMVERRVRAPRIEGDPVDVVVIEDGTPLVDPAYDRVMLESETAWMVELGQALAQVLAKPFYDRRRG